VQPINDLGAYMALGNHHGNVRWHFFGIVGSEAMFELLLLC
jgi:hypothetical protein